MPRETVSQPPTALEALARGSRASWDTSRAAEGAPVVAVELSRRPILALYAYLSTHAYEAYIVHRRGAQMSSYVLVVVLLWAP